jgi:predicted ArsR family transcriptional regulator
MTAPKSPSQIRTRQALLTLLKQLGPTDSQALAQHLGISAMAVRQHLYSLQAEQLVTYENEARAMGRPAKLWQLTASANDFFPNGYAELTLSLLQAMTTAFGSAGLAQLLAVKTHQQLQQYQPLVAQQPTLAEQLAALASLRTQEGYMAAVEPQPDGAFLLIENHCPICAAATACTGLCDQELAVFQTVLGQGVDVVRSEHIVAGARRCVYRVTPNAASGGSSPGESSTG